MSGQQCTPAFFAEGIWDQAVFSAWSEQAMLPPEEEGGRLAARSLAQALEAAIREELSPSQRQVLERHWFEGQSAAQIARELGLNRSTVSRTLRRAQDKLRAHLKYAVVALRGGAREPAFHQAVAQAAQVLAASGKPAQTIGERIAKQRELHAVTQKQLAAALSVDEAAVSRWERDVELPDTIALMRMALLFAVQADALLFGEGEGAISQARPCKDVPQGPKHPHPSE